VAALLYGAGAEDHLIAAGALHDVLEKTPTTVAELQSRFGSRIASLVQAVSEDDHISDYAQRKSALRDQVSRADDEALMLFAADKISKARELRRVQVRSNQILSPVGRSSVASSRQKLWHYRECLELLRERVPRSPLLARLDSELRTIETRVRS
jgi:(p)ppGpp synthase/HD superfamily hydrolase